MDLGESFIGYSDNAFFKMQKGVEILQNRLWFIHNTHTLFYKFMNSSVVYIAPPASS